MVRLFLEAGSEKGGGVALGGEGMGQGGKREKSQGKWKIFRGPLVPAFGGMLGKPKAERVVVLRERCPAGSQSATWEKAPGA